MRKLRDTVDETLPRARIRPADGMTSLEDNDFGGSEKRAGWGGNMKDVENGTGGLALVVGHMSGETAFAGRAADHRVADASKGLAISVGRRTTAKALNPRRIFAMGGLAVGIGALIFLGGALASIARHEPSTFFVILGAVMAVAAVVAALPCPAASETEDIVADEAVLDRALGSAAVVIGCITVRAFPRSRKAV